MPREKRRKSKTGIYHIMLRGINGDNIFMDYEDRIQFMQAFLMAKKKGNFLIYGYCLMDNHVHLLVKEGEEIGKSIKRITVSYVQWYNNKYNREGHLFQNRYKSEVVEKEAYLLIVLRYIHQNPIKAKMVNKIEEYKWSSYNQYVIEYDNRNTEVNTDIIMDYFKDKESFERYMNEESNDKCLDYCKKTKYSDTQLKSNIKKKYVIEKIEAMPKNERNKLINRIKKDTGCSIRQLSRVLDLGRGVIERATKE